MGALAAGDYNDDGWPDLYVGTWNTGHFLYLNDGAGRFVEATSGQVTDEGLSFGVRNGDIDNDGDLDIFQAVVSQAMWGAWRSPMYINLGAGIFVDATEGVGLTQFNTRQSVGPALVDTDNDGDLDLMVAEPPALYLNDGTGYFSQLDSAALGVPRAWTTATFGDFDLDGSPDVCTGGTDLGVAGKLYRGTPNANHWLRVELAGVQSNRSGIGARLTATAGDLRQIREIYGGWGLDQDEMVAHFGLGQRRRVDTLQIRWPSGQVDVLRDLPADQRLRVVEGQGRYHRVSPARWVRLEAPDSVVTGTPMHVSATLRPPLFAEDSRITSVVGDLSLLGGEAAVPLAANGDGTYALDASLVVPGGNGRRAWSVLVEQTTSLGCSGLG
ncbi:MAG: CRTAC1 family protein [Candidatus Latescibacterota bacterium]